MAIRVVGVADSSSLLVADDVNSSGLDDALLTHLCAAKTAGSPLSSLLGLGTYPLHSTLLIIHHLHQHVQ